MHLQKSSFDLRQIQLRSGGHDRAMQITHPYPGSTTVIDPALIRKHDVSGPRYTSYPTADRFTPGFGEAELRSFLEKRNTAQPWSLYMHLPFCDTLCYYCACNKDITRDHGKCE